jgi:hypothetical protein
MPTRAVVAGQQAAPSATARAGHRPSDEVGQSGAGTVRALHRPATPVTISVTFFLARGQTCSA